MLHEYFQLRTVPAYYPIQMKTTSVLLQQLLKSPDGIFRHVRQYVLIATSVERKLMTF